MKRLLLLCIVCMAGFFSAKAQTVSSDSGPAEEWKTDEVAELLYSKMGSVMIRDRYEEDDFSKDAVVVFTVDTLGRCFNAKFPILYAGQVYFPTERSKQLVRTALSEITLFLSQGGHNQARSSFKVALKIDFEELPGVAEYFSRKESGEYMASKYFVLSEKSSEDILGKMSLGLLVREDGRVQLGRIFTASSVLGYGIYDAYSPAGFAFGAPAQMIYSTPAHTMLSELRILPLEF